MQKDEATLIGFAFAVSFFLFQPALAQGSEGGGSSGGGTPPPPAPEPPTPPVVTPFIPTPITPPTIQIEPNVFQLFIQNIQQQQQFLQPNQFPQYLLTNPAITPLDQRSGLKDSADLLNKLKNVKDALELKEGKAGIKNSHLLGDSKAYDKGLDLATKLGGKTAGKLFDALYLASKGQGGGLTKEQLNKIPTGELMSALLGLAVANDVKVPDVLVQLVQNLQYDPSALNSMRPTIVAAAAGISSGTMSKNTMMTLLTQVTGDGMIHGMMASTIPSFGKPLGWNALVPKQKLDPFEQVMKAAANLKSDAANIFSGGAKNSPLNATQSKQTANAKAFAEAQAKMDAVQAKLNAALDGVGLPKTNGMTKNPFDPMSVLKSNSPKELYQSVFNNTKTTEPVQTPKTATNTPPGKAEQQALIDNLLKTTSDIVSKHMEIFNAAQNAQNFQSTPMKDTSSSGTKSTPAITIKQTEPILTPDTKIGGNPTLTGANPPQTSTNPTQSSGNPAAILDMANLAKNNLADMHADLLKILHETSLAQRSDAGSLREQKVSQMQDQAGKLQDQAGKMKDAAQISLINGIVSGAISIGSGAINMSGAMNPRTNGLDNAGSVKNISIAVKPEITEPSNTKINSPTNSLSNIGGINNSALNGIGSVISQTNSAAIKNDMANMQALKMETETSKAEIQALQQNLMQKQNEAIDMLTNIIKNMSETQQNIMQQMARP